MYGKFSKDVNSKRSERRHVNRHTDKKYFSKTADGTRKENSVKSAIKRGGYRL